MKANYNVTGEDRKQLVAVISREAGIQPVYTRMPPRRAPMLRLIASPPLGYLDVKPAHLLRQMLTVQTPKKF